MCPQDAENVADGNLSQGFSHGKIIVEERDDVRPGKPSKFSRIHKAIRIFIKWLVLLATIGVIGWGLEPSFGEPGHCLPLKGSRGFVVIAEAVTLEQGVCGVNLPDDAAEGRVADIKKTTRMLQKLEESIEEQGTVFNRELQNLEYDENTVVIVL